MAALKHATRDPAASRTGNWTGLDTAETHARHARGQGNDVPLTSSRTYARIIRDNALLSINVIIFIIGIALVLMGLFVDALLTAGLVALNVIISITQEIRAKRALDKITLLTRMRATVIRDGTEQRIGPEEIVLGDLLVARPGDQVMVDGRILSSNAVEIDQSLLTGESDPVTMRQGDTIESGSFCVSGDVVYEAIRVGMASTANQLTSEARAFEATKTPLQHDIDLVLRVMVIVMLVLGGPIVLDLMIRVVGLTLAAFGGPFAEPLGRAYQNYSAQENVQAIAIVVGIVPQGLALMLTVTYAMGAIRLVGQHALLQQASGIESLSHVDVVCLDKTGTLTTNRLAFHAMHPLGIPDSDLARALGAFAANTSSPNRTIDAIRQAFPGKTRTLLHEVPFSSSRKWSGMAFADGDREALILGAPEVLQPYFGTELDVEPVLDEWTSAGLRVILLARAPLPSHLVGEDGAPALRPGLQPIGIVSLSDELNADARVAIDDFHSSGITVKIISGDHPETVAALARQAGLGRDHELTMVSGRELAAMTDSEFALAAEQNDIFGRISPQQKVRLVEELRAGGHYVAMIGDGVNDALAVKRAQVGVAMEYGSQATRAVADLVLLSNAFTALPSALNEGRRIVRASHDMLKLFLSRSISMVITILAAGTVTAAFPFIPTHNFLPAFLTVGVPTFFIAAWARPGETPANRLRSVMSFIIPASMTIGAAEAIIYISFLRTDGDLMHARTVAITVAVLCGILLILFVEPPTPAWTGGDTLSGDRRIAALVLVLLLAFGYVLANSTTRQFFDLAPLSVTDLLIVAITVTVWATGLRAIWRGRLLQRFLMPGEQAAR